MKDIYYDEIRSIGFYSLNESFGNRRKVLLTLSKENIYLSLFIRIERVVGKYTRRE